MAPGRLLCIHYRVTKGVLTLTFDLPMLPVDIILRFYMTLYILDIIHGKFQTHTIHISSVTVDQILALKWPIWSID